jgi:hypothetical protein
MIDGLLSGRRRSSSSSDGDVVRYRVHRFDFLLHPRQRPRPEPSFELDQRPDLSIRLSPPEPARSGPPHVSVRLHSQRPSPGPSPFPPATSPGSTPPSATPSPVWTSAPWLHVVTATRSPDDVLRHSRTTVAPGTEASLFAGPVSGALEVAIWRLPAAPARQPVIPVQPGVASLAPGEGLVDAMATLVWQTTEALPQATPLFRATLLPFDAPQTIATPDFVLELTSAIPSSVASPAVVR